MTARSLYFVNRWVDSLAVGGLSILTATAPLALADASDTVVLTALVFPVALLVNYPHFSARCIVSIKTRTTFANFQ